MWLVPTGKKARGWGGAHSFRDPLRDWTQPSQSKVSLPLYLCDLASIPLIVLFCMSGISSPNTVLTSSCFSWPACLLDLSALKTRSTFSFLLASKFEGKIYQPEFCISLNCQTKASDRHVETNRDSSSLPLTHPFHSQWKDTVRGQPCEFEINLSESIYATESANATNRAFFPP